MRLNKRSGLYKASNVTFNPSTMDAFSYSWWKFVGLVQGKLIFNTYRYSPSTARHQSKVRSLLRDLGVNIDLEIPVPRGLPGSYRRSYSMGDTVTDENATLASLIQDAEEHLCTKYLEDELKKQERYQRTKARKLRRKLEEYLETKAHFRDYEITDRVYFGNPGYMISTQAAVHRVVEASSLENDVQDALHSFHRDGFGKVVFYV